MTHLLVYNINTPSKYLQTILFTIALSCSPEIPSSPMVKNLKFILAICRWRNRETKIIYKDFCLFCLKKWSVKPQRSSLFALLIMPSSALRHERVITKWKRRPLLTCVFLSIDVNKTRAAAFLLYVIDSTTETTISLLINWGHQKIIFFSCYFCWRSKFFNW